MILSRLKRAAMIGIALLIVALTLALFATRATLADTKRQFSEWQVAVQHAQEKAEADAYVEKLMKEAKHANDARLAQADFDALRERYARLVRSKAASGAARRSDLPAASDATFVLDATASDTSVPVGRGDGVPAGTILIAQADALICAENTAYAQAAYGWAQAVAAGELPQ